ncbi:hypothetical protein B0H14DRAFT_2621387 [Mycena olivaceomarginata]|nr:hypothetical protein B0H14DRAFT_2621387 [Mycena olivaceomarginata]
MERSRGVRIGGAKEDGVPEWRWMKSRSSRVNRNGGNESGMEREWLTRIDQPVGYGQVISIGSLSGWFMWTNGWRRDSQDSQGSRGGQDTENLETWRNGHPEGNSHGETWSLDLEGTRIEDSGPEAEPEGSLGGVVVKGRVVNGNEVPNRVVGGRVGTDITMRPSGPLAMTILLNQDTFLTASTHTVPRLGGSPSKLFATLQDFAGKIVRRRQLMCDHKRAQTKRVRTAEGVTAHAEHRAALQYTEQLNQRVTSPAEDAVSIPSSGDTTNVDEPLTPVENSRAPTPAINPNAAILSSSQGLLYPLSELEGLMINSLRMGGPPSVPASLLSPPLSLPDLVPTSLPLNVFQLLRKCSQSPAGGGKTVPPFVRGRALTRKPVNVHLFFHKFGLIIFQPNSPRSEMFLRCSDIAILVPPPVAPARSRLQPGYVNNLSTFKPRSVGSRARKNKYVGESNPSRKLNQHNRKVFPRAPKRCYYCASAHHLAAIYPMHEID